MAAHITSFYLHVVADVISNVRDDFASEGIDETVLLELQSLWELNMMQRGAIQGCHGDLSYLRSTGHPFTPSVHDLNMPYAGETPTAELLFPPTPAHTPGPSFVASGSGVDHPDTINSTDIAIGRPAPYMPSPWSNQKPDINLGMNPTLDMNVAYEGGDEEESSSGQFLVTKEFLPSTGKRKREACFPSGDYVPQQDGAGDSISTSVILEQPSCGDELLCGVHREALTASDLERRFGCKHIEEANCPAEDSLHVPQLDGIDDNYNDGVAEEDYNEPGLEEHVAVESVEVKPTKPEGHESDEEPPLNEDDDLDDIDGTIEEERCQAEHVVYAQFEKVTRAKNKWKCILRDGIMHLNGRDLLFSRAMGEFEF